MLAADFFLDVLHVRVPGAVHFGHHLCGLFDHKRFGKQVELEHLHLRTGDDDFLECAIGTQ